MYYIHKDNLGSFDKVTDQSGSVVDSYSFDAWGNRRSTSDWTASETGITHLFSRGFTGHEHLDEFGLINMNGRCYDPLLGRFLSPDPDLQDPSNIQNYNRYSYCLNNPLKYTDPSGYLYNGGWAGFKQSALDLFWLADYDTWDTWDKHDVNWTINGESAGMLDDNAPGIYGSCDGGPGMPLNDGLPPLMNEDGNTSSVDGYPLKDENNSSFFSHFVFTIDGKATYGIQVAFFTNAEGFDINFGMAQVFAEGEIGYKKGDWIGEGKADYPDISNYFQSSERSELSFKASYAFVAGEFTSHYEYGQFKSSDFTVTYYGLGVNINYDSSGNYHGFIGLNLEVKVAAIYGVDITLKLGYSWDF